MGRVDLFSWNPHSWTVAGRRLPFGPHVNNFGDLLGPMIVRQVLREHGIASTGPSVRAARLVSVGSVLHFTRPGDVVWGTGANGKVTTGQAQLGSLDIRAVRGPLTHDLLARHGVPAPQVFGDPGLLIGQLWPRVRLAAGPGGAEVLVVPNLNDVAATKPAANVVDPRTPVREVIARIATSQLVVGSSLHAIVVADALKVPARLLRSAAEHPFKYEDYYLGSGRGSYQAARDVAHAMELGGEPLVKDTPSGLLAAFPYDLWGIEAPMPATGPHVEQDRA
jgi:pyruvyltransferase